MGVSLGEIAAIFEDLQWKGNTPPRLLDIGTQNVYGCRAEEVIAFINRFDAGWREEDLAAYASIVETGSAMPNGQGINGAWLGDLLVRAGFDYVAYDIFEGFRTKIVDLNTAAVPPDDCGAFDIVLNCGTSEHILNQYNVFKAMHDASRIGGVMHHAIPMTGYLTHGYFTYTPKLFYQLAQANGYELIRIDFVGPQRSRAVTEELANGYAGPGDPDASIAAPWQGVALPDSLLAVTLRRTNAAPFRPSLEASTAAAAVAGSILSNYYRPNAAGTANDADSEIEAKKAGVDRAIDALFKRVSEPGFDYREIVRLADAHKDAYGGSRPFAPALEKIALDAAIAEHPDRDDLRMRLAEIERLLEQQWPLYRWRAHAAGVPPVAAAMDGVEASLLSLATRKERFENAVAAFCRYLTAGQPERFPLALEFEALCYAAETLDASYSTLLSVGAAAGKLSTGMRLRRAGEPPVELNKM